MMTVHDDGDDDDEGECTGEDGNDDGDAAKTKK